MYCVQLFVLSIIFAQAISHDDILNRNYHELDKASIIFDKYINEFNKKYSSEEEYNYRFQIFKENLMNINEWNKEHPGMFGINHLTDLKFVEFTQTSLGLNVDVNMKSGVALDLFENSTVPMIPDHLDWRDFGYVSPVKNQFTCGSCYVFSALAHIESLYSKKYNKSAPHLSEQQIIDCDKSADGCCGGYPANVINYVAKEGIMKYDDYPYESKQGDCVFDKNKVATEIKVLSGQTYYNQGEDLLKAAVAFIGPISIAMYSPEKMSSLKTSKVVKPDDIDCSKASDVNHAVLLVGYGEENGEEYWIIKNSWGSHWGDRGYMKLARGVGACLVGSHFTVAKIE